MRESRTRSRRGLRAALAGGAVLLCGAGLSLALTATANAATTSTPPVARARSLEYRPPWNSVTAIGPARMP